VDAIDVAAALLDCREVRVATHSLEKFPPEPGPGAARAAIAQLDANTLADRGVIIAGNPESCIKTIKMYEDIGVDQCLFIMQTETIPHDKAMESIELFGKEVIPVCH
jgi:alkanesulfonate monooxygenase SsuD/methylene tetrahydromethanopterin reductase-like flavin-dependent oxidoreductase (luciferase family)